MSILRISEFEAKENQEDTLFDFLKTIIPMIETSIGLISCQLLRNADKSNHIIIIEKWKSIEDHKESAKNIPEDKLREVMPLLASPPKGTYYQE